MEPRLPGQICSQTLYWLSYPNSWSCYIPKFSLRRWRKAWTSFVIWVCRPNSWHLLTAARRRVNWLPGHHLDWHLPAIFSVNSNFVIWQHTTSCESLKYLHPVPLQASSGWWKHLYDGVGSSVIFVALWMFVPDTSSVICTKTVTAHNCCICKHKTNHYQFKIHLKVTDETKE
jgi:hypothetical protein